MSTTIDAQVRLAFAAVLVGDHIDHIRPLAREIRDRAIERLLIELAEFLHGKLSLRFVRAGRFLETFDELASEPAEHVVGDRGRMPDIRIFCKPARLKALIS